MEQQTQIQTKTNWHRELEGLSIGARSIGAWPQPLGIADLRPALLLGGLVMGWLALTPMAAVAEPTAANDNTNTQITREGDRFDISGGTRSGDRANLFHSFEQFDLDADQIANFLSSPDIQNILGRVVGGEASFINGLIQVTGGNSNLYLMNPAGIVFGSNARLDVPADFTATTADGIGVDSTLFSAFGDNDYANLVGTPDGYRFSALTPGSVVNAGSLSVTDGASLTLAGGSVINTGTLTALGGTVTIAAVPGEHYVRVQQEGMLLGLELETLDRSDIATLPFTPLSLPELLTGEAIANATDIHVNTDGSVSLSGSGLSAPTSAGTALVAGAIATNSSAPAASPEINILGTQIALLDANLNASGPSGGTLRIGGDYRGQGTIPNAQFTYVDADTTLTADGLRGDGGRIIVWADDTTQFYGDLSAQGSGATGTGGFVEVSGKDHLAFAGTADLTAPSGNTGTLLLDPENIIIVDGDGGADDTEIEDGAVLFDDNPAVDFVISEVAIETASAAAAVILEANGNITLENLTDNTLSLESSITFIADADQDGVGTFSMNADDVIQSTGEFDNISFSGAELTIGQVVVTDGGDIDFTGDTINFIGGENSIRVTDDETDPNFINNVSIQPQTENLDTIIGASENSPNALDISRSDLAAIEPDPPGSKDGFNVVTFRSNNGTGDITIASGTTPITVEYDLNLQTETGAITLQPRTITAEGLALQGDTINVLSNPASIQISELAIVNGSAGNSIRIADETDNNPNTLDFTTANWSAFEFEDFSSIRVGNTRFFNLDGETNRILINSPLPTVNSVTLAANEINLNAGPGTITATTVTLTTGSTDQPTLIGGNTDTGAGTLDITNSDLAAIDLNTFGTLSVGAGFRGFSNADVTVFAGNSPINLNQGDFQLNAGNGTITIESRPITAGGLSLTADEVDLEGEQNSIETEELTVRADSFNQDIVVGGNADTGAASLDLTAFELNRIRFPNRASDQFTSISISAQNGNTTLSIETSLPEVDEINLSANEIDLLAGANTLRAESISLRPAQNNPARIGGTADTGADVLDLTNSDLDAVQLVGNNPEITFTGGDVVVAEGNMTLRFDGDLTIDAGTGTLTVGNRAIAARNIVLEADELELLGTAGSIQGRGITIATGSDDQRILLGATANTDDGALELTADELSTLRAGRNGITIDQEFFTAQDSGSPGIEIAEGDEPLVFGSSLNLTFGSEEVTLNRELSVDGTLTLSVSSDSDESTTPTLTITENLTTTNALRFNDMEQIQIEGDVTFTVSKLSFDEDIVGLDETSVFRVAATENLTLSSVIADGGIFLTSENGSVRAGALSSTGETGGEIQVDAATNTTIGLVNSSGSNSVFGATVTNNLTIGDVTADGGIFLTSEEGSVTAGNLNSAGETGSDIQVIAATDMTIGSANSSGSSGVFRATATDDLTIANVSANGGIFLTSEEGSITAGNLNSAGESGGEIQVIASTAITTGSIDSSGSVGDGGDVMLDPSGDIEVEFINARGGESGFGGMIDITTASNFRATGTFEDGISLSSEGSLGDGSITIRHGGGTEIPFIVGNAGTNGTAGSIRSGEVVLNPVREFLGSFERANLAILTTDFDDDTEGALAPQFDSSVLEDAVNGLPVPEGQIDTFSLLDIYRVEAIEELFSSQYADVLNLPSWEGLSLADIQGILQNIEQQTGVKPAVIYVVFSPTSASLTPESISPNASTPEALDTTANHLESYSTKSSQDVTATASPHLPIFAANPGDELWRSPTSNTPDMPGLNLDPWFERQVLQADRWEPHDSDQLEILMVTSDREVIRRTVPGATRALVTNLAREYRQEVTRFYDWRQRYLPTSQKLYQWLIEPIISDLETQEVDNLVFSMDIGLRSVPLASLHDGDQFLVERYSVGLVPSLSLTDTHYVNLQDANVLAMGASEFETLSPLPGVPIELSMVANNVRSGATFLNEEFTFSTLREQQDNSTYRIIHLATHANFVPGKPDDSYIQLWDQPLRMDMLRTMGWYEDPGISLAVLSACQTALGDAAAELGFAGFAVQSGAQSVLASLWAVDDLGTLMLMTEFYQNLRTAPIRAEALQEAQIELINGNVRIEDGQLLWSEGAIDASTFFRQLSNQDFTHPYFWSAFTMVGSPW